MNTWAQRATAAIALATICYLVPPVRLVPLAEQSLLPSKQAALDPPKFARQFWEERLLPSIADAAPALDATVALAQDPHQAEATFGRKLGVGRSFFVYLQGEGEVVATDAKGVTLQLAPEANAVLRLARGPLFGNAIRDATGLLARAEVPDSSDFNAVSSELNLLAEQLAEQRLAPLAPGDRVRFAGCGKIGDPRRFTPPLVLTAILVEVR
jgi:predicted lipoprotein